MSRFGAMAAIVGQCVGAAVVYGVLHDQVTARLCLEYFTVFHPRLVASESPTLLALLWGVLATWWVGVFLGVPLAAAAQAGPLPRLTARDLRRPTGVLLGVMAAFALAAGAAAYALVLSGSAQMLPAWADRIPPDRHARFMADLAAHNASYLVGFLGGNVLLGWTWRERRRRERLGREGSGQEIGAGRGT